MDKRRYGFLEDDILKTYPKAIAKVKTDFDGLDRNTVPSNNLGNNVMNPFNPIPVNSDILNDVFASITNNKSNNNSNSDNSISDNNSLGQAKTSSYVRVRTDGFSSSKSNDDNYSYDSYNPNVFGSYGSPNSSVKGTSFVLVIAALLALVAVVAVVTVGIINMIGFENF